MTDHDFDRSILDVVAHRPWAMPAGPWLMTQTWHDLLFAHWRVDPRQLASKVPADFPIDVFDGDAWIGIVPFRMTNVAPRGVPSLPWVSAFPELNVRTYVRVGDKPGVYFFSLDAGSQVAVQAARTLLNLPYYAAAMTVARDRETVVYDSRRPGEQAEFHGSYAPGGPEQVAVQGTVEYFLTERYCLYHVDHRGSPYRLDIHHPPWPLQAATARIERNTMGTINGLDLNGAPALLHFARRLDVVAWGPAAL